MHGFEINPLPKVQFKYTSNNVPNEPSATKGSMKSFDKTLHTEVSNKKTLSATNVTKLQ